METFLNLQKVLSDLQIDPATANDPVKRMFIFEGAHLTVNIASGTDSRMGLHTQPEHDELIVVLEGQADFKVGEEVRRVSTGDIVFIPRNTLHGRVRTYSEKWAALSVYGPHFDRAKKNIEWQA
jgi:quercetin dioxygenase-like cupin family protein